MAMSDSIFDVVTEANQEEAVIAATEIAASAAVDLLQETSVQSAAAPNSLAGIKPQPRPNRLQLASLEPVVAQVAPVVTAAPEVVTRMSTSGSRHWGVNIGTYGSEYEARKVLLKTALSELENLDGALRKVSRSKRGYDANFLGLSQEVAALTCRKLAARGNECKTLGPS